MFEKLFQHQSLPVSLDTYNVVLGDYPNPTTTYDAYLVTGSKFDSFGSELWIQHLRDFLATLIMNEQTIVGICFGHQLLSLMLGGKVDRSGNGWGIGVHTYRTESKKSWMTPFTNEVKMLVSHQDQVSCMPANAELLATSEFCPVAAYQVGDRIICFQGHPEFTSAYSRALIERRCDKLSPAVYIKGLESLNEPHQGSMIASWITHFVAQSQTRSQR